MDHQGILTNYTESEASGATPHLPNIYNEPVKVPRPGPTFSDCSELVTFHIGAGNEKKTFLIHKEVAVFYSPVLGAAFNSDFLEGQTQTYTLEDVSGDVFQLLAQWFYRQKLEYYLTQAEADSLRRTANHTEVEHKHVYGKVEKRQELLVRLWVLADRLDIPRLQNLVVDELESIRRTWDDSVAWHCLAYVYENTVEDCCLRELLLLHCRCFLPREVLREHADDIPKAFLVEYALGKEHDWVDWTDRQDFRRRFHVPVMEEGIEDGFYGERDDTDEEDNALDGSANYDTGFTDGTDGFGGDWGDSLQAEEHSN